MTHSESRPPGRVVNAAAAAAITRNGRAAESLTCFRLCLLLWLELVFNELLSFLLGHAFRFSSCLEFNSFLVQLIVGLGFAPPFWSIIAWFKLSGILVGVPGPGVAVFPFV